MEILNCLRAKDAARYIGIATSTFWCWVQQGKLPQADLRMGARVTLWKKETLDKALVAFGNDAEVTEKNKLHSVKMIEAAKKRKQNLVKRDEVSA